MKKIKIGVLGAGRQGAFHALNIAFKIPNAQLAAVADPFPTALKRLSIEGVKLTTDFNDIFSDPEINGVVIATPTDLHEEMIIKAANAGKNVFCEKPIALDPERIDKALDAVKKNGVKFQIGLNRRFDPSFTKIKEAVSLGKIGTPTIINITSRDPAPPHFEYLKVCGGFYMDTTVHDFDMARYIMQDEVEELYATGGALFNEDIKKLGDIDTAMVVLKFKNGAVGSINNCRQSAYGFDQRVEIHGTDGMLSGCNKRESVVEFFDKDGSHLDRNLYFFNERYPEAYCIEIQGFVNAIADDTETPATARDAKISVLLSMSAKKSFKENRPIKIDYSWVNE